MDKGDNPNPYIWSFGLGQDLFHIKAPTPIQWVFGQKNGIFRAMIWKLSGVLASLLHL